ncbi:MAG: ArsA-related P-loop ATPase [Deltaproteobacteria bacterium]|nr:ArsA-related P-loop ATPase [Deltaproteobacteria bacterium]
MQAPLLGRRLVICAGPGGVGKTTTAASFAVAAARSGLRTVVATIDPAPRLVDALALPQLDAEPRSLPHETAQKLGIPANHLFAARIDTEQAFARLVQEFAQDAQRKQRILENSIYQQITTTLTGAQEYAAALYLQTLYEDKRFDMVVLDTPPAANALEFFDAPSRLAAAIASPLIKWLIPQTGGQRLLSVARLGSGGGMVLRALSRLVGSRFLSDLGAFLADFQPVLEGFLARTQAVQALLHGPDTAVVGVCIAEPQAMDEAIAFSRQLQELGVGPRAFIVNRVLEPPPLLRAAEIAHALEDLPAFEHAPALLAESAQAVSLAAITVHAVATEQARQKDRLASTFPASSVTSVPLLESDGGALYLLDHTAARLQQAGLVPHPA